MYNSVVISVCSQARLWNCDRFQTLEHSHGLKEKHHTHYWSRPISCPLLPPVPYFLSILICLFWTLMTIFFGGGIKPYLFSWTRPLGKYITALKQQTGYAITSSNYVGTRSLSKPYQKWEFLQWYSRLRIQHRCSSDLIPGVGTSYTASAALKKKKTHRRSHRGTAETNLTRNHEVTGSIPSLTQWVKDLALLWLWCRPAATALTGPLAWEPPYAMGVALKRQTNKKPTKTPHEVTEPEQEHCLLQQSWLKVVFGKREVPLFCSRRITVLSWIAYFFSLDSHIRKKLSQQNFVISGSKVSNTGLGLHSILFYGEKKTTGFFKSSIS